MGLSFDRETGAPDEMFLIEALGFTLYGSAGPLASDPSRTDAEKMKQSHSFIKIHKNSSKLPRMNMILTHYRFPGKPS